MKRELKTNNKIQLRIRIAIILFLSVLPQNKLFYMAHQLYSLYSGVKGVVRDLQEMQLSLHWPCCIRINKINPIPHSSRPSL